MALIGRRTECLQLEQLVELVRSGQSAALVVQGEPGVGKTALLDYAAAHAPGCRVVRASGVQSEMELPFAGLHQLCGSMLDLLDHLPGPQRDALATVFGLEEGPAPHQFLVGLAVLSLLSEAAAEQPLLCLVDDHQWLDHSSRQALAFVARRLGADSLGLFFTSRVPGVELAGLPMLTVPRLSPAAAGDLLESVLAAPLDRRVRDQIVAETRGNPLAILELTRRRTVSDLAGGFTVPGGGSELSASLEEGFRRRTSALPAPTRTLLLIAAADPTGDPALVWRAASRFGIDVDAATAATAEGLAEFGTRAQFRHPLARAAAYWSAPLEDRRAVHRALAEVTDATIDPDRRSWHLAEAAGGPDEAVADELERSADRAQGRGGLAAAAAFRERSAALTLDPSRRASRALAAAMTHLRAGALEPSVRLLEMAEAGPLSDLDVARVGLVRAQLAFILSRGGEAPLLLLTAAQRLETIDPRLARETYLEALTAATFAGSSASPGGGVLDVARAAATAPPPSGEPRATDLLLDGLAANFTDGYAAGVPRLRQALAVFGAGAMSEAEELKWMWQMTSAALHTWDDDQWIRLTSRYVELARQSGALTELPLALSTRAMVLQFAGDLGAAASLVDEQAAITEATGSQLAPYSGMFLAAMRGDADEANGLIESTTRDAPVSGEGISVAVAEWTRSVLHNGLGNYSEAMAAAQHALDLQEYPRLRYPGVANWAAAELIEAAARSGMTDVAEEATDWICEMTEASRTDWALGVEARARAQLAEGAAAEALFRESILWLRQTRVRSELARARLLYGEWLRRERRRIEAREQLRMAQESFGAMGMTAFAERARNELLATGETARRRTVPTSSELTAQESLIARLASDGLSNPEIASRLFISSRTVQYHLRKVFTKLGIRSRSQLDRVLSQQA